MKTDLFSRGIRRGVQKRDQLFVNISKNGIMLKQSFVDFSQSFQNGAIDGQDITLLDKSSYYIDTHRNRLGAVENIGRHDGSMFGEGERAVFDIVALLQGHNL